MMKVSHTLLRATQPMDSVPRNLVLPFCERTRLNNPIVIPDVITAVRMGARAWETLLSAGWETVLGQEERTLQVLGRLPHLGRLGDDANGLGSEHAKVAPVRLDDLQGAQAHHGVHT